MRDYRAPSKGTFDVLRSEKLRVIPVRTTCYALDEIAGPFGGGVLRAGIQMWVEEDNAWYFHLSEPYRDSDAERAFEIFCAGFDASAEGRNGEYTSKSSRELTQWLAEEFEKHTGMPAPEIVEGG